MLSMDECRSKHSLGGPILWAVVAAAAAIRIMYLLGGRADPTLTHPIIDAAEYQRIAMAIAQGNDAWGGPFSRPPLFPHLLAGSYALLGTNIFVIQFLNAVLASGTCLLTILLGQELFDRTTGLTAGGIVALYGPMIFFDGQVLASSLVVFAFTLVLLLTVRAMHCPTVTSWLWVGLAMGVAALARPNILLFAPVVIVGVIVAARPRRSWGTTALHLLAGGLAMMLMIAPATLHNYRRNGEFILITDSGGLNLFLGNNLHSLATLAVRPGYSWEHIRRMPHSDGLISRKKAERFFVNRVSQYAKTNPGDFGKQIARKARLFFNATEVPRNVSPYFHRKFSSILSILMWRTKFFGFPFGLIAPLALVGVVMSCHNRPDRAITCGYIIACAASVILFFNASRYRLPIIPPLTIFAAWAAVDTYRRIRDKMPVRIGRRMIGGIIIGFLINAPAATPYDKINFEAALFQGLANEAMWVGDLDRAGESLDRVVKLNANSVELFCGLSYVARQQGQPLKAMAHAREAVRYAPESPDARIYLASELAVRKDFNGAEAESRLAIELDPGHDIAHSTLGMILFGQHRFSAAADAYGRAVHFQPAREDYQLGWGRSLIADGQYAEAESAYSEARWHMESPRMIDALAWLLATCPDPAIRDPKRALALSGESMILLGTPSSDHLDTRAAAMASAARFDEAVAIATRAVTLARSSGRLDLATVMNARRNRYRAGKDIRDPRK